MISATHLRAYYGELHHQAALHVGTRYIKISDVHGLQTACDVLDSIIAEAMTTAEAAEYINDTEHDNLPGIIWARKAVHRAHSLNKKAEPIHAE